MSLLHSKNKRPQPLQDKDYDHEIQLVDHTQKVARGLPSPTRERPPSLPRISISESSSSTNVQADGGHLKKHRTLREELTKRKYKKYQDVHVDVNEVDPTPNRGSAVTLPAEENAQNDDEDDDEERGRARSKRPKKEPIPFEIDVLYENQRGVILCGLYLFSSAALGNLDPSAWTNVANKTSATNTTNAQVPDPSWEWAWPEWRINHDEGVDEDGWEYSFAFSRKFSWHNSRWYNSFVRRRIWIRKRVKKSAGYHSQHAHILNEDYFTIRPVSTTSTTDDLSASIANYASDTALFPVSNTDPNTKQARSRSRSRAITLANTVRDSSRYSMALSKHELEEELRNEDICDIGSLMSILRICRIDREKMEAVESFIKHGGDELHYLAEHMHEIMNHFIFQASRRLLLSNLMKNFDEALDKEKDDGESMKQRAESLEAAVKAADEEVKRLEYWSDVKDMAESGTTKGAVDSGQGWRENWEGADNSGPKDVISDAKLMDVNGVMDGEGRKEKENGFGEVNGNSNGNAKGKEKARD
ncbi:meiotically up-regulated 65 protein [Rutstroemia sp. NJR-2017a BVV2]|nr:meiotically up-regulated 65 protein [Rutstroemia sp. NJR-2017a BVV2]